MNSSPSNTHSRANRYLRRPVVCHLYKTVSTVNMYEIGIQKRARSLPSPPLFPLYTGPGRKFRAQPHPDNVSFMGSQAETRARIRGARARAAVWAGPLTALKVRAIMRKRGQVEAAGLRIRARARPRPLLTLVGPHSGCCGTRIIGRKLVRSDYFNLAGLMEPAGRQNNLDKAPRNRCRAVPRYRGSAAFDGTVRGGEKEEGIECSRHVPVYVIKRASFPSR